jgi:hypothetical protein
LAYGVHFVRRFPSLEVLTLVVRFKEMSGGSPSKLAKLRNKRLSLVASIVLAEFRLEVCRDPTFHPPIVRVIQESNTTEASIA